MGYQTLMKKVGICLVAALVFAGVSHATKRLGRDAYGTSSVSTEACLPAERQALISRVERLENAVEEMEIVSGYQQTRLKRLDSHHPFPVSASRVPKD